MTCGNCARHVVEAIQTIPGVYSATVDLANKRASVRWGDRTKPNVPLVLQAVQQAGYGAKVAEVSPPSTRAESRDPSGGWQLHLWIAVLGTVPLMLGEWVFGVAMEPWFRWLALALGAGVQVFAGAPFYRGAWNQLRAGSSNMDTLVALGSTTAFAYSTAALFANWGGHLYFMEAASIITIISVGHWMEARISARASSSLKALLNLAPSLALLRGSDGTERAVPVSDLELDDLVNLRPGDRVPTDGTVADGQSALDESMLTGESAPVDKAGGDKLFAGTVNMNGQLLMRVTAIGETTALAHIIAAVQRAQGSRANIQRLGDQVSSVFVPVVVVIALAAGLWWGLMPEAAHQVNQWLSHFLWPSHPPASALAAAVIGAASVLIIACPCAMGLATPAAIMAGCNAAAQRGILIRDGIALEKAGTVTAVLFDKTGTLTVGKPEVARIQGFGSPPRDFDRVVLAATLARRSSHPLSQAVARQSSSEAPISDWREVRGSGVQAYLSLTDGKRATVRLGSLKWLSASGVDLSPGQSFIEEWSSQGASILGLANEDKLAGLVALKDVVKAGANRVIRQLHRQGLRIYLVTGDNPLTAASIARQTGIPQENVSAEVRPEEKAGLVRKLQQEGEKVAFVGDGINDAPALEQADLGIAVSRASDVAREAADIILLNSDLEAVPESLGLAQATLRTIKQNLFWAFFYNAAGIPLAALGFMDPVVCALAMGFSDLIVIGNALRLRRWRLTR